ncbi:MAG TPA: DUF1801 domain-containing protein [Vicinamibacterales bacterium]|nr:DUF1801 domain-containing protein [Vicinamibacterales bacterium]
MKRYTTIDEYLAAQPRDVRQLLAHVRRTIRKAVPAAVETISYGIPAYKLDGRVLIYFAGWKEHYALYPSTARLVAALQDELAPYDRRKGTIRFPLTGRVPAGLIGRIARFRAREVRALAKARAPKARKGR